MREAPFECLVILDGLDEDQMQDMHTHSVTPPAHQIPIHTSPITSQAMRRKMYYDCIPSEHMGPIRLKS